MKQKKIKMPIKRKITIIFGCFFLLMLVLLWLLQMVFLEDFYQFVKTRTTRSSIMTIVNNIEHKDLDTLVERMQYEENINIQIFDIETRQEQFSFARMPHPSLYLSPDFIDHLVEVTEGSSRPYSEVIQLENFHIPAYENGMFIGNVPPPENRFIETTLCAVTVTTSLNEQWLVVACAPISPIDSITETLKFQLMLISIVLLVLFFPLIYVVSRQIAKPIVDINQAAHKLALGNYAEDFKGEGYEEISELSTTLNYAARELGKVEQLRQDLIANVSHDLRTPLTMIKGYSEMMRDIPGENTPENIQIIIDETTHLNSLVTDMLDLSKLQAKVSDLTLTTFNLTQSIQEVLTRYVKFIEQNQYQITFSALEEIYVIADQLKILQVIYNLINNAINYTGEDKKVIISQQLRGDYVRISVQDTGPGISEDQKPYIWQRYYRIDKNHKRSAFGTGLGLSIVKNILDLHNAPYGVDSCEGKGSTFWFELKITTVTEETL